MKPQTALLAGLLFLVLTIAAVSASFPDLTGRVVDNADLIDAAQEAQLVQTLADFETKSSDQIVVATIVSLDGEPLERYANDLFRHWGLGQAGENNGVLLLVARDDRKIRIEVGYGLEGTLTDLHSKLIIENTIVPAFRSGDFAGGIVSAVDDMIAVLSGNAAELEARARRNTPSGSSDDYFPWPAYGFFAIWFILFFGTVGFAVGARLFGKKLGPGKYKWLGVTVSSSGSSSGSRSSSGWSSSSSSGFSGGGGSSGGGGASGSW